MSLNQNNSLKIFEIPVKPNTLDYFTVLYLDKKYGRETDDPDLHIYIIVPENISKIVLNNKYFKLINPITFYLDTFKSLINIDNTIRIHDYGIKTACNWLGCFNLYSDEFEKNRCYKGSIELKELFNIIYKDENIFL